MSTSPDPNTDTNAAANTAAGTPQATAEPDAAPTAEPAIPETPESLMQAATARITALETELAEMKDRWMRAEAETANIRARARREVEDARQYAVQSFAKDIVEAAENLRRGLAALPAAAENEPDIITRMREGFESVERGFLGTLERHGIASQDPMGQPFDPNLHQAMMEQESAAHAPGSVMQAWTTAWTLHGRLLRPAMVVVAKQPQADPTVQKHLDSVWDRLAKGEAEPGYSGATLGGVQTLTDHENNQWHRDQNGIWREIPGLRGGPVGKPHLDKTV